MQKDVVLTLAPGNGNPRNSEGAFLHLADGRILFVYSRYRSETNDFGDDATCDLAARTSRDGGRTWDAEERILISHGDALNVMSVSLLRTAEGRILMVYLRKTVDERGRIECTPFATFSDDEGDSWSTPFPISRAGGYFVVNNDRLLQLKCGSPPVGFRGADIADVGNEGAQTGVLYIAETVVHQTIQIALVESHGFHGGEVAGRVNGNAVVADTGRASHQVNGKIRARAQVAADASQEQMLQTAKALPEVQALLEGKTVVKQIAVPGKLVNLVVR